MQLTPAKVSEDLLYSLRLLPKMWGLVLTQGPIPGSTTITTLVLLGNVEVFVCQTIDHSKVSNISMAL